MCELGGADEHLEGPDGERGTESKEREAQHQSTLLER